ncbi:hypothetical protein [Streptomyces rectiverticillatus]|uniref:hypothetical protein n=1 Tax=Streptomyces rectiverticillatus TaxID=173860 RepID=UPI0015C3F119|nr:hypothetical protein [Streptomyces rectiverticillatus]
MPRSTARGPAGAGPVSAADVLRARLTVHEHPLMVLEPGGTTAAVALPEGLAVQLLGPDDPALPSAAALGPLAFSRDGTADRLAARIRAGLTVAAAAVRGDTALCSGMHQPVVAVTELVGIGTLPAVRRQGPWASRSPRPSSPTRGRGARRPSSSPPATTTWSGSTPGQASAARARH